MFSLFLNNLPFVIVCHKQALAWLSVCIIRWMLSLTWPGSLIGIIAQIKSLFLTDSCHLTTRRGQHGALAFGLKILAESVSGDNIQIHSKKLRWTVFIKIYQFLHIFIIYHYKNSQSKLLRINWNIISRHTHCQYFLVRTRERRVGAPYWLSDNKG